MVYCANKQTDIKLNNQKLIIDFLSEQGPTSRADIAKQINSSKPTVSKNVEDLLEKNILIESGKADNSIGKKGVLLDINKDFGYVMGIDLSKDSLKSSVNNLKSDELCFLEQSFDKELSVISFMNEILEKSNINYDKIMKIVISYPGVIGHNGAYYLSNLKRKETILKEIISFLKNKVTLEPIIKNDINLAICAEQHHNKYLDAKNLYYVSVDTGVGAGIIIDGQLYEGDRNAAGEIGFIVPSSIKKNRYSTLEEIISVNALINQYKDKTLKKIDLDGLSKLIMLKDSAAYQIYDDVVEYTSIAISNITSILDIENVVISGRVMNLRNNMVRDITKRVNDITPFNTTIYLSKLINPCLKGVY